MVGIFLKFIFVLVSILAFFSAYSLKISEVYFDGSNEFIGIYNKTENVFSGTVVVLGAKASKLELDLLIPKQTEIIIGDDVENLFSGYKAYLTGLSLTIADTKPINIELLQSGNVLDTFYVSGNYVKKINDKKTSFEKIFYNTQEVIKPVETPFNNVDGYKINPGFVNDFRNLSGDDGNLSDLTGSDLTTGVFCDITFTNQDETYTFVYTGNFNHSLIKWYVNETLAYTGNQFQIPITGNTAVKGVGIGTGFTCASNVLINNVIKNQVVYVKQNVFTGKLIISEIHPKNDNFPEYIELKAMGNFSGDVVFSGLGRGDSTWTTHITLFSGNYLIIAKNSSGFNGDVKIYESMSLLDGGETLKIFGSGLSYQVNYQKIDKNKSYYPENEIANIPSPGFGLDFLNYYEIQKEIESSTCKIEIQSTGFSNNRFKINLKASVSSKFCNDEYKQIWTTSGQVLSTGTCNPSYFYFTGNIANVEFKIEDLSGNVICKDSLTVLIEKTYEKITEVKEVMKDVTPLECSKMSSTKLNELVNLVRQKYKTDATLKRIFDPINFLYYQKEADYFKKLTSRQLRQLVDKTLDRYSERTLKYIFSPVKPLFKEENTEKQFTGSIKILQVLPNSKGKDINEQIILSGDYITGLKLKIKNRTYKLPEPLFLQDKVIFSGKLNLPNKETCFSVVYNNQILDFMCYSYPKEGKVFTKENFVDYESVIKKVKVIFSGENIHFYMDKNLIRTVKNKALKKLISKIKKAWKKVEKRIKKLEKANKKLNKTMIDYIVLYVRYYQKYEKVKKKYEDFKKKQNLKYSNLREKNNLLKQEKSKQFKNYRERLKKKNQEMENLKNQISYLKSFIYYLKPNIDKKIYQKHLQLYKQVRNGEKVKFNF